MADRHMSRSGREEKRPVSAAKRRSIPSRPWLQKFRDAGEHVVHSVVRHQQREARGNQDVHMDVAKQRAYSAHLLALGALVMVGDAMTDVNENLVGIFRRCALALV
jgi:hypothetical protein